LEEIGVSHPNGNVKVGYTATYTGRKIIDDDTLDALLDGEMNIKEFLDS